MNNNVDMTYLAGLDLSSHQYKLVKFSGAYVILSSTRGDIAGVLQNKPDAQEKPAIVRHSGISLVVTDGGISAGHHIISDSSSRADTGTIGTGTGVATAGIALQTDGGAGSQVQALISIGVSAL